MRHVPTTLYIDTQVFKKQGLRLDTRDCRSLLETFERGGIRLLVPAIMERELFRHYKTQATKCGQTFEKLHKEHPFQFLKMWPSQSAQEVTDACLKELHSQWEQFKSHFTVKPLPLVGKLEDVVEWYFAVEAPFSEGKPKEFPDAFVLSALEAYHEEHKSTIAVVSEDNDLKRACATRRYLSHFSKLEAYANAFGLELTTEQYSQQESVDPTQPIVTEDLTELRAILNRGAEVTGIEIKRVMRLLQSRGENYHYFFQHAVDPHWLPHLKANGSFGNVPDVEFGEQGSLRFPDWPPIYYLARVFASAEEQVGDIVEALPLTQNPRVLEGIVAIALKSDDPEVLLRLSDKILAFVDHARWGHEKIIALLNKPALLSRPLDGFTESFLLKLVGFLPDPRLAEQQAQRTKNLEDSPIFSQPTPRFEQWEYHQILSQGVRPFTRHSPYRIARILIDATAHMIRLRTDLPAKEDTDEDFSEVWCPQIDESTREYEDSAATLVHTLTYACEQVYESAPESVVALNEALRNQRSTLFRRIREHLYALNPSDQTKPWIAELVLAHKNYAEEDYDFEFQRMVRRACEHFGASLLSKDDLTHIFESILSGPSKQSYRDWLGSNFTEERFAERKKYFHRKQLTPFVSVLFGRYSEYFQELVSHEDKPITDRDFLAVGEVRSGTVSYRSPRSMDEMLGLSDQELLNFLNEWHDDHRDKLDWLVEINKEALAEVFKAVFRDKIIVDGARLRFWLNSAQHVQRPIYVRAIVQAIQESVKGGNYERFEQWFAFCRWILAHPDQADRASNDESKEAPDWRSSRRSVGDFVGSCLEKDSSVPISLRAGFANLLDELCTQPDSRLDAGKSIFLNKVDYLTDAINNLRSRALEDLIDFGYWIRRHLNDDNAQVPEVFTTLEKRLCTEAACPLTRAEYAIIGANYGRLFGLSPEWSGTHKALLFPRDNTEFWYEGFHNFLRFNRPFKAIFDVVRDDFLYALDQLGSTATKNGLQGDITNVLGEHIFTYYLWDIYPLTGEDSLLERYYGCIKEPERLGRLFNHVGRSLSNSGKFIAEPLRERIFNFFEWRLEQKIAAELNEFTFWLRAECLDQNWRLKSFSRILDAIRPEGIALSMQVDALQGMLEETALVLECFAKLTDHATTGGVMYFQTDKIKPILAAGMQSHDTLVRQNAERARENLLRCGRFEFLDEQS